MLAMEDRCGMSSVEMLAMENLCGESSVEMLAMATFVESPV